MNYKDTVFLPRTDFPMRGRFANKRTANSAKLAGY